MVTSGTQSNWWPVSSGVSEGLTLMPILLNAFMSDLNSGTEYALSSSVDGTKLVVSMLEGRAVVQRDLKRLEEWSDRSLLTFHNDTHPIWNNPMRIYGVGTDWQGSSFAEKDLRVLVNQNGNHQSAVCPWGKDG
ncbi:triadin [Grus japonensis]|uniref:Triadin n=1 Tax=Grus japonensis TaxID=30415 RepID=A0ABC9WI54_GRUJA